MIKLQTLEEKKFHSKVHNFLLINEYVNPFCKQNDQEKGLT
jgi:hypothetical protein